MPAFVDERLTPLVPGILYPDNSMAEMLAREAGYITEVANATLGGTGSQSVNVFEFTGTILVIDQYARITRAGTLTNCTGVYADIYDGTVAVKLTDDAPGATLSNAPVGTFFTKGQDDSQPYDVMLADQVRLLESPTNPRRIGRPFLINAKPGVSNYIRFNYTTTDSPVDFDLTVWFTYWPINGSTLSLA